jgi:hypothetical protein
MQKAVLKGTRWLLLKNPENLDKEKVGPSMESRPVLSR